MYVILNLEGYFFMKIFKTIVLLLLLGLTLQTAYFALIYKVEIATGMFLICARLTLLVVSDGGLNSKNSKRNCLIAQINATAT